MPAILSYRPPEDALVAAFVDDLRRRTADFSEYFFSTHRHIALHFLIWIDLTGAELRKVDDTIVYRFLRHDCCCGASCASVRIRSWRKRPQINRTHEVCAIPRAVGAYRDPRRAGGQSAAAGRIPWRFARRRLRGQHDQLVQARMHRSHCLAPPVTHLPFRPYVGCRCALQETAVRSLDPRGCFVVVRRGYPTHTQPKCAAS